MPLDDTRYYCAEQRDVVALLERGLSRVRAGYCAFSMYRPKRWYRRAPQYCMLGSLILSDNGEYEDCFFMDVHIIAQEYLIEAIGGRKRLCIIAFGTRPFVRGRVIRAYQRAIRLAEAGYQRDFIAYRTKAEFEFGDV